MKKLSFLKTKIIVGNACEMKAIKIELVEHSELTKRNHLVNV